MRGFTAEGVIAQMLQRATSCFPPSPGLLSQLRLGEGGLWQPFRTQKPVMHNGRAAEPCRHHISGAFFFFIFIFLLRYLQYTWGCPRYPKYWVTSTPFFRLVSHSWKAIGLTSGTRPVSISFFGPLVATVFIYFIFFRLACRNCFM